MKSEKTLTRSSREAGATAVEYTIMAAAIAAVVVAIVFTLGGQTLLLFDSVFDAWS